MKINMLLINRPIALLLVGALMQGCISNSLQLQHDQNVSFGEVLSYAVSSADPNPSLSSQKLIESTHEYLENNGKLMGDIGFVDAQIEIDHFEQERPNENRLSIGLGTGSYGRSGGISFGTAVSVPLGSDTIQHAVVVMRVLVEGNLVWAASSSKEIDGDNQSDLIVAQLEALEQLLRAFPITRKIED